MPQAVAALLALDEPAMAGRATEGVLDDARRRGSVVGFMAASFYRLAVEGHRGRVKSAEADLRRAVEISLEHGLTFALPGIVCFGVDVLLERPDLDDLATLLCSIQLEPALASTASGAWLLLLRGRLRARRGEHAGAAQDLREAGRIFDALGFTNPIVTRWRSPLALALPSDAAEEARELVDEELRIATAAGLPRARGVALRAAGCLERGQQGVELLERSLGELQREDDALERARTLVELGSALRRANRKVPAREPLLHGTRPRPPLWGRASGRPSHRGAAGLRRSTPASRALGSRCADLRRGPRRAYGGRRDEQPGDRAEPVRHGEDRREPIGIRLPQARGALPIGIAIGPDRTRNPTLGRLATV